MLSLCLQLKHSFNECVAKFDGTVLDDHSKIKCLEEEDWVLVQSVVNILEPIEKASRAMCGDQYVTLSMLMPYFDSVLDALEKERDQFTALGRENEDADSIAEGLVAAYEKLMQYFEISSDLAILATVLDPRFKMDYYGKDSDNLRVAKDQLLFLADDDDDMVRILRNLH
jgi:hypothetical protein